MRVRYRELPEYGRLRCPFCKRINRLFDWPQPARFCTHYNGINEIAHFVRFVDMKGTDDKGATIPLLL